MKKATPFWPIIIALALLKFILPFLLQSPVYELQRDEYLYYEQGQNFDWGFLENPPLLSYLATVSSWLGGSVFWIKFWPCLFGAGTVIITCLLSSELGGKRFAQFIAGAAIISGAYLRIHFLFQPNFLDIFFWTLSVYALVVYINSGRNSFLYLFCFALTFGFLGKYSILFIAASLFLSLLFSQYRKVFAEKKLYLGILIGLLIVSQNVVWQYQHNWPLVSHMKELKETQLRYNSPLNFIIEQFLMLLPMTLIWVGGLIWLLRQSQWRFIGVAYFIVIILLILASGKGYYALGIYPPLLAAGGVAWERWSRERSWIRYGVAILFIGLTWLFIPLALPTRSPEKLAALYKKIGMQQKWEDQKNHPLPQDFADMLGWKELAEKTESAFSKLPDSIQSGTLILCDNYGQAGSLKFYSKNENLRRRVASTSGSFILWTPLSKMDFRNMMVVGRKIPDHELFRHFKTVAVLDSVTNTYSRQFGDKVFFCENVDEKGSELAKQEWLKRTARFRK
ncbi:MAG TPA: glycosyltransferase family 39 protein [Chitinophagaceae bacterium]|nr:glycosyltransferase family 39 protein [Chitinophagaceae bacterium]